ncbi:hypothetical protein HGM15179_016594 [Zosterops borbonicus]|uniref:Uncharacterized protein n=1 Tax=Zosterops borbonicus TaxID=364589 RepID=A0A8K1G2S8_9PASS|nr:hypothetical protein HGM15179_016594 [Zosterops borbonicus]
MAPGLDLECVASRSREVIRPLELGTEGQRLAKRVTTLRTSLVDLTINHTPPPREEICKHIGFAGAEQRGKVLLCPFSSFPGEQLEDEQISTVPFSFSATYELWVTPKVKKGQCKYLSSLNPSHPLERPEETKGSV